MSRAPTRFLVVPAASLLVGACGPSSSSERAPRDGDVISDSAAADRPPSVEFLEPDDGDTVSTEADVEIRATDDVRLVSLVLLVDDAEAMSGSDGDIQSVWDTCGAGEGQHSLLARAEDCVAQRTEVEATVTVDWDLEVDVTLPPAPIDPSWEIGFVVGNPTSATEATVLLDHAPLGVAAQPAKNSPTCLEEQCTCEAWTALGSFTGVAEGDHVLLVQVQQADGETAQGAALVVVSWDHDGDGVDGMDWGGTDCDDHAAAVYPGAPEVCDGRDDDCDGVDDRAWDADEDGYCSAALWPGEGDDCDDADPSINPGAWELCATGVDEDCDGEVDESGLGESQGCPAVDCADILAGAPSAASGDYYLYSGWHWCDMDTDGGGWTMCYTQDGSRMVHLKTETTRTGTMGEPGYRADCTDVEFDEILYVNESSGEKAWFSRDSGGRTTIGATGYNAAGGVLGEWTGHGVASTDTTYQLNICDEDWMWVGLMVSGYASCWKQCGHWCNDTSTDYYRTDGDTGSTFNGVAFAENGHRNVGDKTMSVGIR